MVEGPLLTDVRLHAAHPRRELRVFDIQFDVGGKLTSMAVRAQIVGTRYFHLAHRGQDWFGAQFLVMRWVAAGTREGPLIGSRGRELQQFAQRRGPRLMHRRTHSHFDGFQIQAPRLAPTVEDDAQQLIYFSCDFLVDRFGRFFSCSLGGVSSTGRSRQIFSLIFTKARLNS